MTGTRSPEKRYELVERIAVGGMAEVFRAKAYGPHGFEKVLAIKRILPALAADPKFERRFIDEAKLAVSLSHANIVQVLDFSRFGQSLYIVMEFLDGGDLSRVLRVLREHEQQVPIEVIAHVASELLKGLDYAHRRGVVHRDVSPSNILLSRAGEVKIADFGIAQAVGVESTQSRRIMGKWRYMSPEQTQGGELDARSDVFSAGVVLFELLTGAQLFPGNDAHEIVLKLHTMPLPRPSQVRADLPPELDAPLAAALERDREKRTITAAELLEALVEVFYTRSLPALPTALARFIEQVDGLAARSGKAGTGSVSSGSGSGSGSGPGLLDEIIVSELEPVQPVARAGKASGVRRTAMALGPPAVAPEDLPRDQAARSPELTGTFIRSVPARDGTHRWELSQAAAPPIAAALGLARDELVDDDDDDGDLTRAVESSAPDTPVPVRMATMPAPAPALAPRAPTPAPPAAIDRLPSVQHGSPMPPSASPSGTARVGTGHGVSRHVSRRWIGVAIAAGAVLLIIIAATASSGPGSPSIMPSAPTADPAPPPEASEPVARPDPPPAEPAEPPEPPERVPASPGPTSAAAPPAAVLPNFAPDAPADAAPESAPEAAPESAPEAAPESAPESAPPDPGRVRARTPDRPERRERYGTVDIYSEPWANIYLGKRKVGVAPQRAVKLPHGRHRLKLVNPILKRTAWVTVTVPSSGPVRVQLPAR